MAFGVSLSLSVSLQQPRCATIQQLFSYRQAKGLCILVTLNKTQLLGGYMVISSHVDHSSTETQLASVLGRLVVCVDANGRRASALQRSEHGPLRHASPPRRFVVRSQDELLHRRTVRRDLDAERRLADCIREHVCLEPLRDAVAKPQAEQAGRSEQDAGEFRVGGVELCQSCVSAFR